MNEKETLAYIRENNLDMCPECPNKKRNTITIEGSEYICTCSECGLSRIAYCPDDDKDA